jgi:hypothetical protein
MQILYCSFCEKTFYTVNGMVLHYLRDHYYNFNEDLSYCALCEYQGLSIANHMTQIHPLHCGYCSRVLTANNDHSECKILVKTTKKNFKLRKEYLDWFKR